MKNKKIRGVEALKERYGWICVSFWVVGLLIFFIWPMIQSVMYMFSEVAVENGSIKMSFIGMSNFKEILKVDPDYTDNLMDSILNFIYKFPAVLILSFIIAVLLNAKFRGRLFFRTIYFLPVIIATGVVYSTILGSETINSVASDSSIRSTIFSADDIIKALGLPDQISSYIEIVLSSIMDITWKCGIQIILFIAGMQSIPPVLYEASKVEGASKWEEFWLITFPMMTRSLFLVAVFTMVDIITAVEDVVMTQAYSFMSSMYYGQSSAMLWIYFIIVSAIMAVVCFAFYRIFAKKWM